MKNTFITKTDLAMAYFPFVSERAARHKLMQVVNSDARLLESLLNVGYSRASHLLSPACVELIVERLGNPWK